MSDIVKRLRKATTATGMYGACHEAADEIERLRACLFQMQGATMDLRARLADAEAQIESLQNRWAARPLSHADGEVLARENDELRAELATIKADHADCEEFARRLMDERDAALARLAEAELIAASWKREAEINEQIATEAERDAARYRWLRKAREHWDVLHREDEDAYWQDLAGNELDTAIDAAMAADSASE